MVRRSSMVYELLRSERRDDGFTPKEIIDRVSQTYEITPGKGLRKQVAVALRRGIDFGIVARKNNKYKFDSGSTNVIHEYAPKKSIVGAHGGRSNVKKSKNKPGRKSKRRGYRQSIGKNVKNNERQQKSTRMSTRRSDGPFPPRPRVPRPPNWNPKRRNLCDEPIPKLVKHPSNDNLS